MDKAWRPHKIAPLGLAVLLFASNCSVSPAAVPLTPQTIEFDENKISLLTIGTLTSQPSSDEPSYESNIVISDCYTHRSETIEQVLCWTKTKPDFKPNIAAGFLALLYREGEENLLAPSDYFASPRSVSGFQGIEFESYLRGVHHPTTVRSLIWATSGNVWHLTFFFVTGFPEGEATVEAVFSSVKLEGEAKPIEIYGNVPDEPGFLPRGVERLLIQVTLEGEIILNGKEASLADVREELKRLEENEGVVLYDRAGGHSPPPEAESISAEILFAATLAGVEIIWLDTSGE